MINQSEYSCNSAEHHRRSFLKVAGAAGISLLTPLATTLAREHEDGKVDVAKSLIVLWLDGAPSQLETFDPHPGTEIAAGSMARQTKAKGILLGDGFEQTADQMDSISIIRAVTSKEGDHARAQYNWKTGFRLDTTLVHPAIGSVICHQARSESKIADIPRHVSILPGELPSRGGYLGDQYDAFKVGDPKRPVPDIRSYIDPQRELQRIADLGIVDKAFRSRHETNRDFKKKFEQHNLDAALRMMSSEQLSAFDVSGEPETIRVQYGDTPFGRGCLAARRLIEAGVRCVEVTLGGWDSHIDNHELQAGRIKILDPAFAALVRDLKSRGLLDSTMVVCGGEFGRTPHLNPVGGRDHWPHGFSIALAGGGVQGGRVVGETNPNPEKGGASKLKELKDPHDISDVHSTILSAFGIDGGKELDTPVGRPMKISEGSPIKRLLEA